LAALFGFGVLECGVERLNRQGDSPWPMGKETELDRNRLFPVTKEGIFLAHAAVAPISGPAQDAIANWSEAAVQGRQEGEEVWRRVKKTREVASLFLGCDWDEVSLLGPTALGLGLVALGLDWKEGDEVIYDPLDYPANVYPWRNLAKRRVRAIPIARQRGQELRWPKI
jgi:selenocysteine lyase/cysteine desulfurase